VFDAEYSAAIALELHVKAEVSVLICEDRERFTANWLKKESETSSLSMLEV
jgi:hypothetical protein